MPTKATKCFDAWSYSRLQDYESCPAFAKFKHLDKLPVPAGPAMARGREVHEAAEKYATGVLTAIPGELKLFKKEFTELRKIKRRLQTELKLGLTEEWGACGFFDDDVWCRLVIDLMFDPPKKLGTRLVVDHKTGKLNPSHKDQLSLYAVAAFATAPKEIKRVDTELWYLDQGEVDGKTFVRDDVPALQKRWAARVKPMMVDRVFKPNPGERTCKAYGRPCPFSKKEGGPCRY